MIQNEDIVSDKAELSLMERTSVEKCLMDLESATTWVNLNQELPWREDLILRLELRTVCSISRQKRLTTLTLAELI